MMLKSHHYCAGSDVLDNDMDISANGIPAVAVLHEIRKSAVELQNVVWSAGN